MRAIAILSALLLIGCGIGTSPGPTTTRPYSANPPVVVRLDCPNGEGWGSGLRLSDSTVLTAAHVADCFPDESVPWTSEDRDLAVVSISGGAVAPVVVRAPRLGERVLCMGFPETPGTGTTAGLTITRGEVANVTDPDGDTRITCPIHGGNSGGPVFAEDDGAVVGVVVSRLAGMLGDSLDGWYYAEPAPFGYPGEPVAR